MLRNLKEEKCQRPAANQRQQQLEFEMRHQQCTVEKGTNNGIYLYERPTSALLGNLRSCCWPFTLSRFRTSHPGQPGLDSLDLVREDNPFLVEPLPGRVERHQNRMEFLCKAADAVVSGDERMVRISNGWQRRPGAKVWLTVCIFPRTASPLTGQQTCPIRSLLSTHSPDKQTACSVALVEVGSRFDAFPPAAHLRHCSGMMHPHPNDQWRHSV